MRLVFCALVLGVVLVAGYVTTAAAQEPDPVVVVKNYIAAENARNVERALALFTDDAVVLYIPGIAPAVGKDAIRAYLENLVAGYVEVEVVEPPQFADGKVQWTERLSNSALVTTQRVEAEVVGGKIRALTVPEILRASGRTVPWTGGSGWAENAIWLGVAGIGVLAAGVVLLVRGRQMNDG